MRILFSIEKYLDVNTLALGNHPHEYGMIGAAASAGHTVALFNYDKFFLDNPGGDVDKALVRSVEISKPGLVIATHVMQHGENNVKPETYGYIRDELKIPVALVWFESALDVVRCADKFVPSVSLTIFSDTKDYWKQFTAYPERFVWICD